MRVCVCVFKGSVLVEVGGVSLLHPLLHFLLKQGHCFLRVCVCECVSVCKCDAESGQTLMRIHHQCLHMLLQSCKTQECASEDGFIPKYLSFFTSCADVTKPWRQTFDVFNYQAKL